MAILLLYGSAIRYRLEESQEIREKNSYLVYETDNCSFSYAINNTVKICFLHPARSPPPDSDYAAKV